MQVVRSRSRFLSDETGSCSVENAILLTLLVIVTSVSAACMCQSLQSSYDRFGKTLYSNQLRVLTESGEFPGDPPESEPEPSSTANRT